MATFPPLLAVVALTDIMPAAMFTTGDHYPTSGVSSRCCIACGMLCVKPDSHSTSLFDASVQYNIEHIATRTDQALKEAQMMLFDNKAFMKALVSRQQLLHTMPRLNGYQETIEYARAVHQSAKTRSSSPRKTASKKK